MKKKDILDILMNSEKRRNILKHLKDGGKNIEYIKKQFHTKSSSIMVQIRILIKYKMIEEINDNYQLTELGNILTQDMYHIIKLIDVIEKQHNYLKHMNIKAIPNLMINRLEELKNTKLIIQENTYIFDFPKELLSLINDSLYIMEVSSIFKKIYVEEYIKFLDKNISISLIFTKNIINRIKKEYPLEYKKYIKCTTAKIFIIEELKIASLVVTNLFMSLSLFTNDGYYINHYLSSNEKETIKWGQDLFIYYRNLSQINEI